MSQEYKRFTTLPIDEVLRAISREEALEVDGMKVSVRGPRLRTFLKGTTCAGCGIKGTYFVVEATKPHYDNPHLNLYAKKGNTEIMMTSDHIYPKSKGGGNALKNRQPMCLPCNHKKADNVV